MLEKAMALWVAGRRGNGAWAEAPPQALPAISWLSCLSHPGQPGVGMGIGQHLPQSKSTLWAVSAAPLRTDACSLNSSSPWGISVHGYSPNPLILLCSFPFVSRHAPVPPFLKREIIPFDPMFWLQWPPASSLSSFLFQSQLTAIHLVSLALTPWTLLSTSYGILFMFLLNSVDTFSLLSPMIPLQQSALLAPSLSVNT